MSTLTSEPSSITAGDTISWSKSIADYPADSGWQLHYVLINASGKITIDGSAFGEDHLISVPSSTSSGWAAGDYNWQSYVTKAAERYTISTGTITIQPNLVAASSGIDLRSHARKLLDAIEAWLESRDPGVAEYEIAGRRMKYISPSELLVMRDRYRQEVLMEENANRIKAGGRPKNKLLVRF